MPASTSTAAHPPVLGERIPHHPLCGRKCFTVKNVMETVNPALEHRKEIPKMSGIACVPFAVLYILVTIFITGNLYSLILLIVFTDPPAPAHLAMINLFSQSISLFLFFFFFNFILTWGYVYWWEREKTSIGCFPSTGGQTGHGIQNPLVNRTTLQLTELFIPSQNCFCLFSFILFCIFRFHTKVKSYTICLCLMYSI